MKTCVRIIGLLCIAAGFAPATAAAGIWTAVESGTTDEISAIEHRLDATYYTTTSGKIFKRGTSGAGAQQASFPGRQFFDIAISPDGTKGLATADTGRLYRLSGGTWSEVSLANSTYPNTCQSSPGETQARNVAPTANLLAVEWASNDVAWVISAARGQVLKSGDGGATWAEASRQADRTCRVNAMLTDVAPVPGSLNDLYFVDESFAGLWRTADALASSAQKRKEMVNCFDTIMKLAVDPASPNRVSAAGVCDGSLHWGFTADAGTSHNYTESGGANLRDLAGEAGVFIAVGDAGKIEQSFDGDTVFVQPAEGGNETKDWRAVDFADQTHAAIGGVGGALVMSDRANEMPDVVAPTVTIAGPTTVTAGVGAVFTANATDNANGVGIDPAGFQWTGTGLTPTNAGTATYTFPSTGTFTIRVKARDLRGNVSQEATYRVTAVAPVFAFPGAGQPPVKVARKKGRFVILKIKGRLPVPAGLAAAQACRGNMVLRVRKGRRTLVRTAAPLSSSCTYKKRIRIKRKRVGKAKKLTLLVRFAGNGVVGAGGTSYTVRVR